MKNNLLRTTLLILSSLLLCLLLVIGWYWSQEPDAFELKKRVPAQMSEKSASWITGYATTYTLITVAQTLFNKPGGYISNDVTPPGLFVDNIRNWEFGVVVQIRDMARILRNDFSRSQTQSREDPALSEAEPHFNFDNNSWLFPRTESKYQDGIELLEDYLERLVNSSESNAQFYARADNLREWLKLVETRLGSLSQQLSASVGQKRLNTDLAGDANANQSTRAPSTIIVKTPWLEIDDVFYEARGQTWALVHLLKAIEIDFRAVLENKNALVSLQQIIRELESTQQTVWSPMILNGSGFGILVNHSLIMASYISRANAGVIDLRSLLSEG